MRRRMHGTYRENNDANCRNFHISITVKQMSAKYNMATWFNFTAIYRYPVLYLDQGSIVGSTTAAECWRRGLQRNAIGSFSCGGTFCITCPVTRRPNTFLSEGCCILRRASDVTYVPQHTASKRSSREFLLFVTVSSFHIQHRAL